MMTGDAYGELLLSAFDEPDEILELVERDDGFIMASRYGPRGYYSAYSKWP
jgi:hypothetical protein